MAGDPNWMAALENSIPEGEEIEAAGEEQEEQDDAPSADDQEEALDEEAPEETEGAESDEKAEAGADGELELGDEDEITIDGEAIKVKDFKAERMRQADYTRKTQALADERREFESERDEIVETNEELKSFVASLRDVETLEFELARYFPDTLDALKERVIAEALEVQDMTPREREAYFARKKADHALKARDKTDEYRRQREEKQTRKQSTAKLRETFTGWMAGSMAEHGLDAKNAKHQKLLRAELAEIARKEVLTEEHFKAAAKEVADTLGIKSKSAPKATEKKLPPARPVGKRAPAEKDDPKARARVKRASEDVFEEIRRKHRR